MKNTEFLKTCLITNKGVYDNKLVYENTLESFKTAIMYNCGVYINVRMTKDNVLVVYHDDSLTRLMNLKDKISSITYEELNYFSSYHVPTLEEVLLLINGQVPVIISPQTWDSKYYLEKELVKILDTYKGEFAILSNHAVIIKWFNKNRPDYIVGEILTRSRKINNLVFANMVANYSIVTDFKSVNIEYFDILKLKKIKENSLVIGYLIDDQEKYSTFKDSCHNLIIDKVLELEIKKGSL